MEAEDQTQREVFWTADLKAGKSGDKQRRGHGMKSGEDSQVYPSGTE